MSELAQAITAIATLVAALGAVAVGYRNSRKAEHAAIAAETAKEAAEASKREIIATKEGVFEVGKQIDGRLSQLLESTRALAHAEGLAEGKETRGGA